MINWNEILKMQNKLDNIIYKNAGIKEYPFLQTKLALFVEIGELENEIQDFKYWKKHKNVDKEKVLEEWADCIHFAASIYNFFEYEIDNLLIEEMLNIDINILDIIEQIFKMDLIFLESLIVYGIKLGFEEEKLFEAYCKKNNVNYLRQKEGY